jgi:hypothetical protein
MEVTGEIDGKAGLALTGAAYTPENSAFRFSPFARQFTRARRRNSLSFHPLEG